MTGSEYTIETLKGKRVTELRVIFRVASEVSANAALPQEERRSAAHTCLQVRCVLTLKR